MAEKRVHNFIDLTGQVFHYLTVVKFLYIKKKRAYWRCICKCGQTIIVCGTYLKNSNTKSCGCLKHDRASNFKDLKNQVFGRLTILRFSHVNNKRTYWVCKCSCDGKEIIIYSESLKKGNTRSCGCLASELTSARNFKHGMTGTRIYIIWRDMIQRCYDPNSISYSYYGGRNIIVCSEWQTFETFYKDNGESYNKHVEEFGEDNTTADRYPNNDGNYEKSNFRWSTIKEQSNHRRTSTITDNPIENKKWKLKLRSILHRIVHNYLYDSIYMKYFGCTPLELRKYIESQFYDGMTWENYGKYTKLNPNVWNIDHIIGCNNFDLSKEEDRLKCWNIKNLRPMWDRDHKNKSIHRKEYLEVVQ